MNSQTFEIEPVLEDIKHFLPELIQACESVSDLFYVAVTEEAWQFLGQLLQGMDDLYKTSKAIQNELHSENLLQPVFAKFLSQMTESFEAMNRHMDEEEYVQAADIIKYELAPLFHWLHVSLGDEKEVMERRFTANLAYLEQHYSHVYAVVRRLKPDPAKYQITYAQNGLPNLCLFSTNDKMSSFYSKYDPEHEAERWVESVAETVDDKSNVIVYGFGFGYHLKQLATKYPEHKLVVFEPDEQVLLAAMHTIDFQELFSQIKIEIFVTGWNKAIRDTMFYQFVNHVKGETAVISIPVYDKLDVHKKLEFFDDAKTAIMVHSVSVNTTKWYGLQWLKNRLYNMAHVIDTPSIGGLKGRLEGTTAVIVGAGPSLEADIDHLRKLKNHAIIIAAGSAIQSLMHFGITPHLVVSVDGSDRNYDAFNHLDLTNIPFLFAPLIQHKILEDKKRLLHVLLNSDLTSRYLIGWTAEDPVFTATPTVTGIAIQAAVYMGCKEIVFTGQDLSYPGTHVYAPGAKHVSMKTGNSLIEGAHRKVENVQGGMNRANDAMYVMLRETEELLGTYPDVRFINTSQMGAKIKHTEWHSMESTLRRLEEVQVPDNLMSESMRKYLQSYSEMRKEVIVNRLRLIPDQIEELEMKLKRILQKMGTLRELGRKKPVKCLDVMVDIEDIWGTIMNSEIFKALLIVVISDEIRQFDRDLPELTREKDVRKKADLFCEVLGPLIKAMQRRFPELNEIVREAIQRVESQSHITAAEELSL